MAGNPNLRQILIPQHLWDSATELAREEMTSAASIARVALKEYIERRRPSVQQAVQ